MKFKSIKLKSVQFSDFHQRILRVWSYLIFTNISRYHKLKCSYFCTFMNTFLKLGKNTLNSRFIKSVAIKHLTVKRQETRIQ